jgi:branched-chain amino acid transport system permease protein
MSLLDALVQGVLLGGLYALFATGLSIAFGVMRLVNIAHGDLIVLAGFMAVAAVNGTGLHPLASLLLVVPAMGATGYLLQRVILVRAGSQGLPSILVTFGIAVVIENGLLLAFTADPRKLPPGQLETLSLPLAGGIAVGVLPLLTFATAVTVIAALQLVLYRTVFGRSLRATADDPAVAALMGIDTKRVLALAFATAMAVAGVAGVLMGLRTSFDPTSGPARLLLAFEAVIIGGMGSLWGTLAGGIVVGVAQTFSATLHPGLQQLGGHLAFLAMLAIRPQGLFPRTASELGSP